MESDRCELSVLGNQAPAELTWLTKAPQHSPGMRLMTCDHSPALLCQVKYFNEKILDVLPDECLPLQVWQGNNLTVCLRSSHALQGDFGGLCKLSALEGSLICMLFLLSTLSVKEEHQMVVLMRPNATLVRNKQTSEMDMRK